MKKSVVIAALLLLVTSAAMMVIRHRNRKQQPPQAQQAPVPNRTSAPNTTTMTKQFRKTARLAVEAFQVSMDGGASESKRTAANERAWSLMGQAEIEADSEGDKSAYVALRYLAVIYNLRRIHESCAEILRLGVKGVCPNEATATQNEKFGEHYQQQASNCATYLWLMLGEDKYTGECEPSPSTQIPAKNGSERK